MNIFQNITAGKPKKLFKPVLWTTVSNLIGILPFALAIEAVRLIFIFHSSPEGILDMTRLWWVCLALALSMLILYIGEIPAYTACFRGAYDSAAEGRTELAEHLRKLPLGYITRRDPGDLANLMMGNFFTVENSISHIVPQMIAGIIMPLIAVIGLAFIDWRLALSLFAVLPVAFSVVLASTKFQQKLGLSHMKAKIDAMNRFQEYLNGIRVIKAYGLAGERFSRLHGAFKELMQKSIRLEALLGPIILLGIALIRSGLTIMIILGTFLLIGGKLDVITFVLFLLIGTRIYDPLISALANYAEFRYSEVAGSQIVELKNEAIMTGQDEPPKGYSLALENVSFCYGEDPFIEGLSFKIPQGSLTALVGPSGSGKSTVLRLLARFYDPQEGRVLMDGTDMKQMDPEKLLKNISIVFQDVYLFQDTIAGNIRFGKLDASQEEVERAARQANCHDFIMKLPKGYETLVGEGGSTLSGGEKQRISLARAFLKDAPIVMLDEVTASLDSENEFYIQKAINKLIEGRTVLVVAHRLKTIRYADQILVFEKGQVIEKGGHDDLLKQKGLYERLWSLQQEAASWKISS
ncbi:ABC transporter ATP-binding protein [Caldalkalibacillus mannanilyticus]|uniref:ABC transporter ATP-binding protein n=1 Tax=Caldalkalibacillus mannanilyticus TaxID=1418 RepID=UPI000468208F|nr:ABC transporter ATP-binding protein [Caldalkalibacillus mannanilyticus]